MTDKQLILDLEHLSLQFIQHLPPGTSTAAVKLLVGVRPIKAIIDVNVLTMFMNFECIDNLNERSVLIRQAFMTPSPASYKMLRSFYANMIYPQYSHLSADHSPKVNVKALSQII